MHPRGELGGFFFGAGFFFSGGPGREGSGVFGALVSTEASAQWGMCTLNPSTDFPEPMCELV
jgi:hypothetical protein